MAKVRQFFPKGKTPEEKLALWSLRFTLFLTGCILLTALTMHLLGYGRRPAAGGFTASEIFLLAGFAASILPYKKIMELAGKFITPSVVRTAKHAVLWALVVLAALLYLF